MCCTNFVPFDTKNVSHVYTFYASISIFMTLLYDVKKVQRWAIDLSFIIYIPGDLFIVYI